MDWRLLARDCTTHGSNAASDQGTCASLVAGQRRYTSASAGTHQTAGDRPGAGRIAAADKASARCKKHGESGYPHGILPLSDNLMQRYKRPNYWGEAGKFAA